MPYTIRTPVSVSGYGIHTGARVSVRLLPSASPGIVFARVDLPGSPRILATATNLAPSLRCTILRRGNAAVMTPEHFLAACRGMDISGILVEIDSEELPAGDGSARLWCEAFSDGGLGEGPPRGDLLAIREPVEVRSGGAGIRVEPGDAWNIEYRGTFFGGPEQAAEWDPQTDFRRLVAPARTFCSLSDVITLQERGLIRGGTPDTAIVRVDDLSLLGSIKRPSGTGGPYSVTEEWLLEGQKLRFPDEFARHKLLDLMGDLVLAGYLAPCSVKAFGSGHALNHQLVSEIARVMALQEKDEHDNEGA